MDVLSKSTGDSYTAAEFNQSNNELENFILSGGISLSSGDLFQISKSVANYAAHGDFYTDSGAADAYVLSAQGSKQAPTSYADGTRVRFVIGNTNTGASTVNVASLGVKSVVDAQGAALTGGELIAGATATLEYDTGAGNFIIAATTISSSIVPSGRTIQTLNVQDGAVNTGSTILPYDVSIPQNTEGDEYMTLAITPTSAANELYIDVIVNMSSSVINPLSIALFQDSTVNALAAGAEETGANEIAQIALSYKMVAGTASATTFKVRAGGSSAGTTTFNGESGSVRFGGVMLSSITIREVQV